MNKPGAYLIFTAGQTFVAHGKDAMYATVEKITAKISISRQMAASMLREIRKKERANAPSV